MHDSVIRELADLWELQASMDADPANAQKRETLRMCADTLKTMMEMMPPRVSQREMQMEEILRSCHAVAKRRGEATAWNRLSKSIEAMGIGYVTARTYRALPSDDPETC